MHAEALAFVKEQVAGLTPSFIVEIGSLYTEYAQPVPRNPLRALFPGVRYVGIDVRPGPSVDVVADGATWQPDEQPDLVLCCEVLEHVHPETQRAIVSNAYRMLADGGLLIITAAMEPRKPHTWDGHEQGTPGVDYWNVEPDNTFDWLTDFSPNLDTWSYSEERHRDRGDYYFALLKQPVMVPA